MKPEAWAILISAVALLVSVAGVIQAGRSARAAEQSEHHAARSANAAERSADTQQSALEIDQRRRAEEEQQRAEQRQPRWEAVSEGQGDHFAWHAGRLEGGLLNSGLSGATIEFAVVDTPDGQRHKLATLLEPSGSVSGGWEDHPTVQPGAVLRLRSLHRINSVGPGTPMLYLEYSALGLPGADSLGVTIELRRTGEDPRGAYLFRVGEPKYMLRA